MEWGWGDCGDQPWHWAQEEPSPADGTWRAAPFTLRRGTGPCHQVPRETAPSLWYLSRVSLPSSPSTELLRAVGREGFVIETGDGPGRPLWPHLAGCLLKSLLGGELRKAARLARFPSPGVLPPASFPSPSLLRRSRGCLTKFLMTDTPDKTTRGKKKEEIPLIFYRALLLKGNYGSDKITANCKII